MAKSKDTKEIERDYIVPLRSGFRNTARYKRTAKAMRVLQEFMKKHMKTKDVKIGMHLNEFLWQHGIKNPPHHVKVHVWKKDDIAKVELFGHEFKDAVRAEKKKEPATMKDKLAAKLGVDEKAPEAKEEPKAEAKPEEKKTEEAPKAEEKKATSEAKKKPAAKKQ